MTEFWTDRMDAQPRRIDQPDTYFRVDLHAHTTASDGVLAPVELVDLASRRGLSALAITDHDTVAALPEAMDAAVERGLTLVPGVELSTTVERAEVHVLGYFVNWQDEAFGSRLAELAQARVRRISRMVELLNEQGYPVDLDAILVRAETGTVGRPHIARALIDLGVVQTVSEGFDRFLKPGRPAWVPRDAFSPEDAVRLLRDNGALPVLAHPYTTKDVEGTLRRLVPAGLRGLEVFYGGYALDQHAALQEIADRWKLVPTGGSDYHGSGFKEGRELGTAPVPMWVAERLEAART